MTDCQLSLSPSALSNYLKLLELHKTNNMKILARQIQNLTDPTETFEHIREFGFHHMIIDCQLETIDVILNKALEMQMLTADYHYHFTSLVTTLTSLIYMASD